MELVSVFLICSQLPAFPSEFETRSPIEASPSPPLPLVAVGIFKTASVVCDDQLDVAQVRGLMHLC